MVKINGTTIQMTRGDTLTALLSLTRNGSSYTPEAGDVIRFALKHTDMTAGNKEYKDTEPLLTKTVSNDTMQLVIEPEDTKSLSFGTYVYDMQITFANGDVDTFITPSSFVLKPEVA